MARNALVGCVVAIGLLLFVSARAAADMDLTGTYTVIGSNAKGGEYRGVAKIKKVGDIYQVVWLIGQGDQHGVGLIQGDVLAVAWAEVVAGKDAGIAVYKIKKDGSLEGKWIGDYEKGSVLPETLTPAK